MSYFTSGSIQGKTLREMPASASVLFEDPLQPTWSFDRAVHLSQAAIFDGHVAFNAAVSVSEASHSISASYAITGTFAASASVAVSASHAITSSNANSASYLTDFPMTSKVIYVPMSYVVMWDDDNDATWDAENCRFHSNSAGKDSSVALSAFLAKGMLLTKVEALVQADTATLNVRLYKRAFSVGGAITLVTTLTTSTNAEELLASSALTEVIGDEMWWIDNHTNSNTYYVWGYRLTVNVPNVGSMVG